MARAERIAELDSSMAVLGAEHRVLFTEGEAFRVFLARSFVASDEDAGGQNKPTSRWLRGFARPSAPAVFL